MNLPPSLTHILKQRGFQTAEAIETFLDPMLEHLESPSIFADMQTAVRRLLAAVQNDQPIAIYADRDVDGLTGLAILVRTLRSLGGRAVWGSPVKGRGVERAVLERLVASGAKVMVLVDCGTAEHAELEWLASQGIDVIVADHHRFSSVKPKALAWIHPGTLEHSDGPTPAGCVMAFKLAHALWLTFLGPDDPERMDYFLFSHLDLVCLGILADRMPLLGENRILVWQGLRRLTASRKIGIAALTRFFRLTPRTGPLTVREVTWQLIPLLNAGGRLGKPELTAELLITEDPDTARACIDQLLELNTQRRAAQDKSLVSFEKAVLEQCTVDSDPVLVALAEGLEPSVTGLAAQALVRKYGRPTFLFVNQGEECVGSGRGLSGVDLFSWVESHQDCVLKYGGHPGAVGLTIRASDFAMFRGRLLETARESAIIRELLPAGAVNTDVASDVEGRVQLGDLDAVWWENLARLSPFGAGHPTPVLQIEGVESIVAVERRRSKKPPEVFLLKAGTFEMAAKFESVEAAVESTGSGPWTVIGYPVMARGSKRPFHWMIQTAGKSHA